MTRLDFKTPVRRLRPSSRGVTGKVAISASQTAGHESSLERDWLLTLAFDQRVKAVLEQPFTLEYQHEGRERRYTPDMQVEYLDGSASWLVVYEVKYREDLRVNWELYRPRFKAAVTHCRARGWRFKLITEQEIRGPRMENIRFLRRYERVAVQEAHRDALLQSLSITGPTTPKSLLAATWYDKERQMAALCELWRLVLVGEIAADLGAPLTMSSAIWSPQ